MKGIEKLTSIRLAELLTQKNVIPTDVITDALYTQDHYGEPFVEVIVGSGQITEWDLAKLVVGHFQLPFIMASNYDIDDETKNRIPKEELFKNLMVPLDVFDKSVSVVMPIQTPFDSLSAIQKKYDCDLYPYVGLISENKKVLTDMFPEFKEWLVHETERREKVRRQPKKKKQSGDWMNIFDSADAAVRDSLRG